MNVKLRLRFHKLCIHQDNYQDLWLLSSLPNTGSSTKTRLRGMEGIVSLSLSLLLTDCNHGPILRRRSMLNLLLNSFSLLCPPRYLAFPLSHPPAASLSLPFSPTVTSSTLSTSYLSYLYYEETHPSRAKRGRF